MTSRFAAEFLDARQGSKSNLAPLFPGKIGDKTMSSDGILFLGVVSAAFGTFALALGYQSFAEWRHSKRR